MAAGALFQGRFREVAAANAACRSPLDAATGRGINLIFDTLSFIGIFLSLLAALSAVAGAGAPNYEPPL